MSKSIRPAAAAVPGTPLDSKQFPLQAQVPPSANRDQVRKLNPVRAPRQSNRPVERSK